MCACALAAGGVAKLWHNALIRGCSQGACECKIARDGVKMVKVLDERFFLWLCVPRLHCQSHNVRFRITNAGIMAQIQAKLRELELGES
jgi:hypothetical protein